MIALDGCTSGNMVAMEVMLPCEVHTLRTSHEVGSKVVQSWAKVCTKLARSLHEVCLKLVRTSYEVDWHVCTYAFCTK